MKEILQRTIDSMNLLNAAYEIICVNDCSVDNSWSIISSFHHQNPNIKGIAFSRNFGHQFAIYAGIKHAAGDFVAVLDSDGQDPPEILPELFQKCEDGFDVVFAVRKNRKEHFLKKMAYKLFYRIYKLIVPFYVPIDSGDFSVFNKNVAFFIQSLKEKTPFIRGLRSYYGGRQCSFEYDRQQRISGKPKYTTYKLILLALNGATSFSKIPLRLISILGIFISSMSFLAGLYLFIRKVIYGINLLGWTSTAILIIFFGGLNLLVLGIIGEYIGGIFDEVKNRPAYLISHKLGFS